MAEAAGPAVHTPLGGRSSLGGAASSAVGAGHRPPGPKSMPPLPRWFNPAAPAHAAVPEQVLPERAAAQERRAVSVHTGDGPGPTTLVLKCLPFQYSRDDVVQLLQRHGFTGRINFLYLPFNFATGQSCGYAFVNFSTSEAASQAKDYFHQFRQWGTGISTERACRPAWADVDGLDANVEHFRNSAVMHRSVSEDLKPVLLDADGNFLPFPPPTRRIRAPKVRRRDL